MLDKLITFADAPGRALMASLFILAGLGKIGAFEATQAYMESFGLPGFLLMPTIAFEFGAGLAFLLGFKTRIVALLLAGFTLLSAAIFHADFGDRIQQIMFLKNLALAGGFLLLARQGAPGFSLDAFLAARKGG